MRRLALIVAGAMLPWTPPAGAQTPACSPLSAQEGFRWYADPAAGAATNDQRLNVRSIRDVELQRRELRRLVIGSQRLPRGLPDAEALKAGERSPIRVADGVAVQRLTVNLPGARSIAYSFVPAQPRREAVIYHSGHEGAVSDAIVASLLEARHPVVVMYMPALGPNAEHAPVIAVPGSGKAKATLHGHFQFLEGRGVNPLRYFVEPVPIVVNHLLRDGRVNAVTIMGLSGGGWTATLAAALDPRISRSYAIAGSVPLPLRWNDWTSWGDYEQNHPSIVARYLDLYLLAAYGAGRSHVQILHKYDTCCFAVAAVPAYVATIKDRLQSLGAGRYDFVLDDTIRGHAISPCSLARILADLASR